MYLFCMFEIHSKQIQNNMKITLLLLTITLVVPGLNSLARAESEGKRPVDPTSIYQRLGGQPAIDAAVDLFYQKVLADERVNHFFEDVNMKRQIKKQKAFLSAAFGGPVPYQGKSLRKAHADLDLRESDFNAIAGHLQTTLKELKIDKGLIAEVMAVAASTKAAVLNHPESKEQ